MVYRVSNSPVYSTPEEPVFDIAGGGRKQTRFLHKVWYCPKVVRLFLREVDSDDLWGMWAVVVNSRHPRRGMGPRRVGGCGKMIDLRGRFGWAIKFFIELEWIGQSQVHYPNRAARGRVAMRSSRARALRYGGGNSH